MPATGDTISCFERLLSAKVIDSPAELSRNRIKWGLQVTAKTAPFSPYSRAMMRRSMNTVKPVLIGNRVAAPQMSNLVCHHILQ